jgi:hypothetical protein
MGEAPEAGPDGRLDTPNVDNPNDIDTTQERTRVIEVDGVRVVEVTMKPPSAEHLHWLMQNMDKIPPMEQPVVVPPDGLEPGHPRADGPVGYIQPGDPSGTATPSAPLPPDSGGQATGEGLAASEQSPTLLDQGPSVAEQPLAGSQAVVQPGQHAESGLYILDHDAPSYGHYGGDSPSTGGIDSAEDGSYAGDTESVDGGPDARGDESAEGEVCVGGAGSSPLSGASPPSGWSPESGSDSSPPPEANATSPSGS